MTRSAIITGAGSGIGLAAATVLSRMGYELTLVGRRAELLAAAAEAVSGATGIAVTIWRRTWASPGRAPRSSQPISSGSRAWMPWWRRPGSSWRRR